MKLFQRGNRSYDRLCRQIRYRTYAMPSAISTTGTSSNHHITQTPGVA